MERPGAMWAVQRPEHGAQHRGIVGEMDDVQRAGLTDVVLPHTHLSGGWKWVWE